MLGLICVIVAFFICLFLSMFICQYAGQCSQLEWGVTTILGVLVFVLFIVFLRNFSPVP